MPFTTSTVYKTKILYLFAVTETARDVQKHLGEKAFSSNVCG